MAFPLVRTVSKAACSLVVRKNSQPGINGLFNHFKDVRTTSRPFTRSMWCATKPAKDGTHGLSLPSEMGFVAVGMRGPSKVCACGCAGLHTEGDKELASFLEGEIKLEQEHQNKGDLPSIPGFDLSIDGATSKLSKTADGEKVVVSFNINHSVEADRSVEGTEEQSEAPVMHSYPDFHVEFTKDGQSTLSLRCSFSSDLNEEELEGEEQQDVQPDDRFIIDEVSIYKDNSTDSIYTIGSEVMDGNLYDLLMNILEERGIDEDFTERLCELATSLEHSQYIQFLQHLKNISKS